MSRGVNKVTLIGNLGADPDVRLTQSGNSIANLSIATTESWKDKTTGEKKEVVDWHRVVVFGRLAEIAGEYFQKGMLVYVEGQLKTRKWQDQNGQDRYVTEVIVASGGTLKILYNPNKIDSNTETLPEVKKGYSKDTEIPLFDDNNIPF